MSTPAPVQPPLPPPSPDEAALIARHEEREQLAQWRASGIVLLLLVAAYTGQTAHGDQTRLQVAFWCLAAAAPLAYWTWALRRCPACEGHVGRDPVLERCPKCGSRLK